jgi:hypothetical protein
MNKILWPLASAVKRPAGYVRAVFGLADPGEAALEGS